MKRQRLDIRSGMINNYTFEDLYEEISHDWEGKAARLQARRWRALKRSVSGPVS